MTAVGERSDRIREVEEEQRTGSEIRHRVQEKGEALVRDDVFEGVQLDLRILRQVDQVTSAK